MTKNLLLYIFFLLLFCTGLMESVVPGIMLKINYEYTTSSSITGQLITVYSMVFAIFGPLLITYLRRYSVKKVYIISIIIFSLSNLIVFYCTSLYELFFLRILCALSSSVVVAKTLEICFYYFSNDKNKLSIINMGFSASVALGVPLGTLLSGIISWKFIFIIVGILSLLSMIGVIYFISDYKINIKNTNKNIFYDIFTLDNIKPLLLTFLILSSNMSLYGYIYPFLTYNYNFDNYSISKFLLIVGVGGMLGSYLSSVFMTNLGIRKSLILSTSLFTLMIFFLIFKLPLKMLYLITFLSSIFQWTTGPIIQYTISEIAKPEIREQLISINMSALNIGSAVGSILGGIYLAYFSVSYLSIIATILAILAVFIVLKIKV